MTSPTNSPQYPHVVWARSPIVQTQYVLLLCHPTTITKVMELGSKAKLGEYWGLVHGNPGPMPESVMPVATDGLKNPVAIFRGLKRPLHHIRAEADTSAIIYVTNPDATYVYRSSRHGDALIPEPKPLSSVFTTFVSFDPDHVDEAIRTVGKKLPTSSDGFPAKPSGIVLFWEWTECARGQPNLPYDHQLRYGSRML
jgi:hypothetical protein